MATDKNTTRELRRREFLKLTALTLPAAGAILAACAPAAPSPTAAPAKPAAPAPTAAPAKPAAAPKEAIAAIINNLNVTPFFVGVEKGIWLKHGVDLKLKVFTTGNEMAKALSAKDADFTVNASSNYLPALEQGLPMVGLANSVGDAANRKGDSHLSVTARDGSGIKAVQDLAGKKIAFNGAGTTSEYIEAVLARAKLSKDKVQLVNIPPGNTPSALQVGQVDAAVLQEPHGTMVLETVPKSYEVVRGGGYLSYLGVMVTRPDVIQADPDRVQRFIDGWLESAQYTRQHPDEAGDISTRWITGLDANIARKSLKHISYDPRISKIWLEEVEEHEKLLIGQKKLKGSIDIRKTLDLSFLTKALEKYPNFVGDLKATELLR